MKRKTNFFLIAILFLASLLLSSGCVTGTNVLMDGFYHAQYPLIANEGNDTINNIVDETSQYETNTIRLIKIAEKISDNFTDMYWPNQKNDRYFCNITYPNGKSEWTWCPPMWGIFGNNPHSYSYVFDKRGHVRTTTSGYIDLTYDPKWIAYQNTGACESLSIYFYETANRSGFVSRIVSSDSAHHKWNEVLINGEWKYYDVQRYGQVKNTNESSYWFGNRSEYGERSGFNYSQITEKGVFVFNLTSKRHEEEITQYYKKNNDPYPTV